MKISLKTVLLAFTIVESCQSCGSDFFFYGLVTGVLGDCARNSDCGEDKLCIDNTCQANPQVRFSFLAEAENQASACQTSVLLHYFFFSLLADKSPNCHRWSKRVSFLVDSLDEIF